MSLTTQRKCSQCGNFVAASSKFCSSCGVFLGVTDIDNSNSDNSTSNVSQEIEIISQVLLGVTYELVNISPKINDFSNDIASLVNNHSNIAKENFKREIENTIDRVQQTFTQYNYRLLNLNNRYKISLYRLERGLKDFDQKNISVTQVSSTYIIDFINSFDDLVSKIEEASRVLESLAGVLYQLIYPHSFLQELGKIIQESIKENQKMKLLLDQNAIILKNTSLSTQTKIQSEIIICDNCGYVNRSVSTSCKKCNSNLRMADDTNEISLKRNKHNTRKRSKEIDMVRIIKLSEGILKYAVNISLGLAKAAEKIIRLFIDAIGGI